MSLSASCAWSVMPMVASPPWMRTHSWDLEYSRSAGVSLILDSGFGDRPAPFQHLDGRRASTVGAINPIHVAANAGLRPPGAPVQTGSGLSLARLGVRL